MQRPMRKRRYGAGGGFGFLSRKYSALDMAKGALRGVKYLKGLVNSEMFKLDTAVSGGVPDTGGVSSICAIAQGDGYAARTGNSILAKSISWRGVWERTTAGNAVQHIRICIFSDSQQVGDTAPSFTDVFTTAASTSFLNPLTVGRFSILWSKEFILDTAGGLGDSFDVTLPLQHHIRYNGTASSDIQKGGLYIATISTQASANYPTLTSVVRLSYHDN